MYHRVEEKSVSERLEREKEKAEDQNSNESKAANLKSEVVASTADLSTTTATPAVEPPAKRRRKKADL